MQGIKCVIDFMIMVRVEVATLPLSVRDHKTANSVLDFIFVGGGLGTIIRSSLTADLHVFCCKPSPRLYMHVNFIT